MTFTLPIGSKLPPFELVGTDGKKYSSTNFAKAEVLVIFFTCNHCPYVRNSDEDTRKIVQKYAGRGVEFVAINSNSPNTYSEDSYQAMRERMQKHQFPWIYLHDATQNVAKSFGALRTPHFFVFDRNRYLIYTGRSIDSPRDPSKITARDLEKALDEHLVGKKISQPLTNPIGCNVKWEGKDAHWMPPDACDLV